ncbi:BRCA1-A complex subunit Abraxas 1 [Hippoglossus hippoglossus]|uniref:BRCA1-A complex subunit Abraxas 1 n=1 Tax=Hippoglossus hippoglossus TaxID=8267 RepID=UPI00148DE7B7|nr:BRCA1-A complex subunit Abraxas 1 [Hippoglossus hippoglossus]XP_034457514.1 BRCA1-A complex subunit Abraxas 1 [Hippoglossus hippoglossus]
MAEPTVRVSGIVLSSLMFQHLNSDSDSEGLVLGRSSFEEQVTISDSQADNIHIEEIYNIQKHITCPRLNSFYNSVGDVNMEALDKVLADNKQENVIGWYRQRRNTDQRMTFREKLVHENLKTSLSNPHMVFVLLTPSKLTSPGATHRTEYAAFISRSRTFLNIPVLVTNLGLLEQLAYWKVSTSCSAAGYNLTMKKHGSKFFSSNGLLREVNEVNKMNDSLQLELQKACRDVEESESLVETLQADVSALRRRVREKRQNEAGKETVTDPSEHRNNLLLREALTALFASSPLFHTQTLTLEAFPVPVVCGSKHDEHVSTITKCDAPDSSGTNCRKRPRAASLGRERKRRNSKS